MILKCVARLKSCKEKAVGLYTRMSSHEEAERICGRFRVSARTSKKYTV